MTIVGIVGEIGRGKSWTMLKRALEYCNRKERTLVTNYILDVSILQEYCERKGYYWLADNIWDRHVFIESPHTLSALFIPESVVCIDEAGIFINSRNFKSIPIQLLADLRQSRKDGIDVFWVSQTDSEVDKQWRELTQYFVYCRSLISWNQQERRPELIWKRIYTFTASDFAYWKRNFKDFSSHFKTRFAYSTDYEGGMLNNSDRILFQAFNSLRRLDNSKPISVIKTGKFCPLKNVKKSRAVINYDYDAAHALTAPAQATPVATQRGAQVKERHVLFI